MRELLPATDDQGQWRWLAKPVRIDMHELPAGQLVHHVQTRLVGQAQARHGRNDRGPRYGGPRSSVPGREFADRPRDPEAKPMAPKTTERIHDGDDFAFGKIEF